MGIHAAPPCLSAVTHDATGHLTMGALSGQGAATPRGHHTHGWWLLWDSGTDSPEARTSVGLVHEAHGIFYTLHQMFTFELPASHLDVILQQDFCTKMVMVLGWGEEREHIFC